MSRALDYAPFVILERCQERLSIPSQNDLVELLNVAELTHPQRCQNCEDLGIATFYGCRRNTRGDQGRFGPGSQRIVQVPTKVRLLGARGESLSLLLCVTEQAAGRDVVVGD